MLSFPALWAEGPTENPDGVVKVEPLLPSKNPVTHMSPAPDAVTDGATPVTEPFAVEKTGTPSRAVLPLNCKMAPMLLKPRVNE
jgi:hypothetical protein